MVRQVNFLRHSASQTPRYRALRWAWGFALLVLMSGLGYLGWSALVIPSSRDNEIRSKQFQELQALQDKQHLLTSWTAQRLQVLDAVNHIAAGWPLLWASAPKSALSLTSLHVSAQEVRVQAISRGAPELPRWDPKSSHLPLPPPSRPALGSPELLELTHAAPAAASASTPSTYLMSVRFAWRTASGTSSPTSLAPPVSEGGEFQDRLAALRQSLAQEESERWVSSDLSMMVTDLQQGLNQAGVEVQSLKPGVPEIKGTWTRCPIVLKATGSLESLMKFLVAASHRPGVVALTPMSLVRRGSIDDARDREPVDGWTLELTVSRAWDHTAPTSQPPLHSWPVDDANVVSALEALQLRGRAGAVAHNTLNPPARHRLATPFESDLLALRGQVEQAQLAWVGFMASQGTERAMFRWNGRVSVVSAGERLTSGPWKVLSASASGAELAWLGAGAIENPVHTKVQLGPRGVHLLPVVRGAP